jgi:regulator of protease activity HflC (stomatin/prohibitin superfamily)
VDTKSLKTIGVCLGIGGVFLLLLLCYGAYSSFRIDVPQGHVAVLLKRTGEDLNNDQVVAPDENHKGLQLSVLTEGRYFYNPLWWDWKVYPMVEIPSSKLGVRVRLYGKNLPYGHFLATSEDEKGVVPEVLRPGRYPLNAMIKNETERKKDDYVEIVELYDPITITAGYRGIVTNLAGPLPENPNTVIVEKGFRGVQHETLDAGTYYLNPYLYKVHMIDCRSQRFNLGENYEMGFPSKDGFWVTLDGIVEFRIRPEKAAEVFVVYNEEKNDNKTDAGIDAEVIRKVIMPNARSFCRLRGSNSTGREFIGGVTRTAFQKDFHDAMKEACEESGLEIVQALITKINPPQAIAKPVRDREVAHQRLGQFKEQKLQQEAEAKLATEKAMIDQRQLLIGAEQQVVQDVTEALQKQQVAITKASENKGVAERDMAAAKDQAAAILSRKKAEAGIVEFQNQAEASGWKRAVEALGGDGEAFARYVLYQKLAPSYKGIMINTSDSPLMNVFKNLEDNRKNNEKGK